ncbi:MAG: guanylate kinase [Alphaproteobacteria bacterium]|nr:guanylate kinase [Alphaproteobacteria bacterium]
MPDPAAASVPAAATTNTAPIRRRGLMLVLSSPSGAGKTSISRELLRLDPGIRLSVSVTTRPIRPGEQDGVHYFFIDQASFTRQVAEGALLEHAAVFGNSYGTPRAFVEGCLSAGQDVLFDIDWQGTQQLREQARSDVVSIFILPPSLAELRRRLTSRAQDSAEAVEGRMARAGQEMSHWPEYDYIIVNRDFAQSVAQVQAILTAERLRRERQIGLAAFVDGMRLA